jgi:hypothetical protein
MIRLLKILIAKIRAHAYVSWKALVWYDSYFVFEMFDAEERIIGICVVEIPVEKWETWYKDYKIHKVYYGDCK